MSLTVGRCIATQPPLGSHGHPTLLCPPRFTPLTFKEGADPAPGCHPSLAGVLPQRCLQEEDRDPTGEEEDEVGDEEGTWQIQAADRRNKPLWGDLGQAISNLALSRSFLGG